MTVKFNNCERISEEYKKYIFKFNYYRYLLEHNLITLEEYEKSIVQIKEKYNSKWFLIVIWFKWWFFMEVIKIKCLEKNKEQKNKIKVAAYARVSTDHDDQKIVLVLKKNFMRIK